MDFLITSLALSFYVSSFLISQQRLRLLLIAAALSMYSFLYPPLLVVMSQAFSRRLRDFSISLLATSVGAICEQPTVEGIHPLRGSHGMESCVVVAIGSRAPLIGPNICSDPGHIVLLTTAFKSLVEITVGYHRLESAVQCAWFSSWCNRQLGVNKTQHELKHNLSPRLWNGTIENP